MLESIIKSRPPHGGRGLKSSALEQLRRDARRPPHGGRGLKCYCCWYCWTCYKSPSPRRAWIEIAIVIAERGDWNVALPTEGVD